LTSPAGGRLCWAISAGRVRRTVTRMDDGLVDRRVADIVRRCYAGLDADQLQT
jgi:hypothetical protein